MTPAAEAHEYKTLPCHLTEEELETRSREMAEAERALHESEEQLDDDSETWKADKKRLENAVGEHRAKLHGLGVVVREKREYREVGVKHCTNFETGIVETVRIDTGEVVTVRTMTADERQRGLFHDVNAQPAAEA